MKNKDLINYYKIGQELSYENKNFPFWFETEKEKVACLLGYNDFELGVCKEDEEIIKEINKIFGN